MNRTFRARRHAALGDPHRLHLVDELTTSDRTPRELGELVGIPSNLVAHHLNVLERAGLVSRSASEGDGRRRYVRLLPQGLETAIPESEWGGGQVLFVCTRNSARSQFAAAQWRRRTGGPADSAGTHPAGRVHPGAVTAALEIGVDLTTGVPKGYDAIRGTPDLVISVCDRALESGIPFDARRRHWSIPDPVTGRGVAPFRTAFQEIVGRIERVAPATRRTAPVDYRTD